MPSVVIGQERKELVLEFVELIRISWGYHGATVVVSGLYVSERTRGEVVLRDTVPFVGPLQV